MTLLETTYRQLKSAGLVHCAEDFSQQYLNKNKNWYALQKYSGRDFTLQTAISCLQNLKTKSLEQNRKHRCADVVKLECDLNQLLQNKYGVKEIMPKPLHINSSKKK